MPNTDEISDRLGVFARHRGDGSEPIRIEEVIDREPAGATDSMEVRRRRLMLAAAATLMVSGAAGLWALQRPGPSPAPASPVVTTNSTASTSTRPNGQNPAPTVITPTTAPTARSTIAGQVESLDPWEAARLVWIDAQFRASPDQLADLAVANELRSRACLENLGLELPAFDPSRHPALAASEQQAWERRRSPWTVEGREAMRTQGYPAIWSTSPTQVGLAVYPDLPTPTPPDCYPAATGVTYLGGITVYSEDQLLETIAEASNRDFAPVRWAFGRLPGTEALNGELTQCMVERGWANWGELGAPYQALTLADPPTEQALELAAAHADCIEQINATGSFLEASASNVEDFRQAFGPELAQVGVEREAALQDAYRELKTAGLEPLSD